MGNALSAFGESFQIIKKDKTIFLLGSIPILVGILLFYFMGSWVFNDVREWGMAIIKNKIGDTGWSDFFGYLVYGLLAIGFYFIINFLFVLVVTIIASPFNDIISGRVEKIINGQKPEEISKSIKEMFKRILWILFNELKKVLFISIVSIIAFTISFFPVLAPISIILSAWLLSANFLDYCWSRHNLKLSECLSEFKRSMVPYSISGLFFLGVIAIPIVNVMSLPYAVVYYSVVFSKNRNPGLI